MNKRVQTVVAGVLMAAGICTLAACEKKGSGEQAPASGNASATVKTPESTSSAANSGGAASSGATPAGTAAPTDGTKPATDAAKDGASSADAKPTELRAGGLTFTIPATWQSKPPSSQMRLAEARVPGAAADGSQDCAVAWFQFGGSVDDNMTRWKGMVTNADGSPATPATETLEVQGIKVHTIEMTGQYTEGAMMGAGTKRDNWTFRGAIIETPGQLTFVRMTGPAQQMTAQRAAWVDVLKSMK